MNVVEMLLVEVKDGVVEVAECGLIRWFRSDF